MANTSTPIIKEEEEDPFSLLPHTTISSSSLSSSSEEDPLSLSSSCYFWNNTTTSSEEDDEDDEALFVVNLPPHTTTSSSSSISSVTTPFLDLPLVLVLTLEDRKIYTDDVSAYEYWVNNEESFYDWAYSFFIVVHHFLLEIYVQHTIDIDLQYDNHGVNVLYYNNTHPIGISINTFIDDNTDDVSIGSTSMFDRTDTDRIDPFTLASINQLFDRNDGFDTAAPTYDHLLLDPSASINQLFDHWVAESPMERGTEVAYNIFFRDGVSEEPCNAETSCYQADMYFDDSAGAMFIHGNVMIKDKVQQVKPPNKKYAAITWLAILFNGGADVTVYDNTYFGPEDCDNKQNSPIYNGATAIKNVAGSTTGYDKDPWSSTFPELLQYDANPPKKKNGKNWYCAGTRSCPVAAWNQTFVCNTAIGSNRRNAHKAVWPTDDISQVSSDAVAGKNVPNRTEALIKRGNKPGYFFSETVESVDVIEKEGMTAVIEFARRVAAAGEASQSLNDCTEGTRRFASRLDIVGINNNPCTSLWLSSGLASCNPCDYDGIECAPRDLSAGNQCSCNDDGGPRPTPSPVTVPSPTFSSPTTAVSPTPSPVVVPLPTKIPTSRPTPEPTVSSDDQKCRDDISFLFNSKKSCKWVGQKQTNKKCNKKWKDKKIFEWCPKTCDYCPEDCTNCDVKPLYKIFTRKVIVIIDPIRKQRRKSESGNSEIVSILPFDSDPPGQC
ncbi:hypothetical protein FRACYDRAFT_247482 [Fragilariopsis cylindrus CCMP1102]|uniref:ShKT domain-containing protein n=1 Tax=Fragilariopsis cylindrus CCMP1102 TaxID=635003 RepID=A0A1E7EX66_9STRA|nr:hypothetical protein FRACYDRAFT_247482 [Fragilariopsis cylindrus CCMP1102]|eukprot:OEU10405.1 hypothetical protein FRACYDRAFT_247482 [Fragilariopsis cylindrus CCMP1102]